MTALPMGERVAKPQGGAVEEYVYHPEGHVVSAHNAAGTTLWNELYSPDGRHVATYNPSANYGPLFWNHADWLGTERVRTDSTGAARAQGSAEVSVSRRIPPRFLTLEHSPC